MRKMFLSGFLFISCALALNIVSGCTLGQDVEKMLTEASDEINKTCPLTIDAETRLDTTTVLPGKIFVYNYTLVNYAKADLTDEAIAEVKDEMQPQLLDLVSTHPDMQAFRDFEITLQYNYFSNDAQELFSLTFTPQDYQKPS